MTHEAKAKDITHEAKAKDYKNCPRGCSRPRTCPRGLYRYLTLMTQLMSDKYISVGVFQSIRNFYSGLSNVLQGPRAKSEFGVCAIGKHF